MALLKILDEKWRLLGLILGFSYAVAEILQVVAACSVQWHSGNNGLKNSLVFMAHSVCASVRNLSVIVYYKMGFYLTNYKKNVQVLIKPSIASGLFPVRLQQNKKLSRYVGYVLQP
jgi:hypothetical protein